MSVRTATSALLERIEQHIGRLDRVLKDSEDLLAVIRRGDREDRIRELQNRLEARAAEGLRDASPPSHPTAK